MRIAGTIVALLAVTAGAAHATFPGTPSTVVYTSTRDGGGLLAMGADLGAPTRFESPFGGARHAAWSADGSRVAYAAVGPDGSLDVLVTSTNGTTIVAAGPGDEHSPAFAPDGAAIVFVRSIGEGTGDLVVTGADGADERALPTAPGVKGEPAWSPDGRRIAFAVTGPGTDGTDLALVTPEGAELTRLTSDPGAETSPDWDPDGSRIVYSDDGTLRLVSGASGPATLLPGGADGAPVFSPDGERVLFARDLGGSDATELHVVGIGGAGLRRVTRSPGADGEPAWRALPRAARPTGRPVPTLAARFTRTARGTVTVRGTLAVPEAIGVRRGCSGRVIASRVSGTRTVRLARATVRRAGAACTFRARIRIGRGQRVELAFAGNALLAPAARGYRVR